jgi:hypothetical protein
MAAYNVQSASESGITPTYTAVTASDTFANDGRTYLHVKAGGTSVNITINSQTPCNQGADHDIVINGVVSSERIIGPFPPSRFNDSTGVVTVTYSTTTGVTAAAVRI